MALDLVMRVSFSGSPLPGRLVRFGAAEPFAGEINKKGFRAVKDRPDCSGAGLRYAQAGIAPRMLANLRAMARAKLRAGAIDPRAVRTFGAVCRAGSISGAARVLAISQPSVSNTIARLEAQLAVTLFERSRSGIVLTPAGQALERRARPQTTLGAD